jgi:hypothetical protein
MTIGLEEKVIKTIYMDWFLVMQIVWKLYFDALLEKSKFSVRHNE